MVGRTVPFSVRTCTPGANQNREPESRADTFLRAHELEIIAVQLISECLPIPCTRPQPPCHKTTPTLSLSILLVVRNRIRFALSYPSLPARPAPMPQNSSPLPSPDPPSADVNPDRSLARQGSPSASSTILSSKRLVEQRSTTPSPA